jgi:hypothetical protein
MTEIVGRAPSQRRFTFIHDSIINYLNAYSSFFSSKLLHNKTILKHAVVLKRENIYSPFLPLNILTVQ